MTGKNLNTRFIFCPKSMFFALTPNFPEQNYRESVVVGRRVLPTRQGRHQRLALLSCLDRQ